MVCSCYLLLVKFKCCGETNSHVQSTGICCRIIKHLRDIDAILQREFDATLSVKTNSGCCPEGGARAGS